MREGGENIMPSDPNAGLIKALEGFTRGLAENTKAVKELTKEVKNRLPRTLSFTNHPYLKQGEQSEGDAGETPDYEGPYGSGSIAPR